MSAFLKGFINGFTAPLNLFGSGTDYSAFARSIQIPQYPLSIQAAKQSAESHEKEEAQKQREGAAEVHAG